MCIMDWYTVVPRKDIGDSAYNDYYRSLGFNLAAGGDVDPVGAIPGRGDIALGATPFDGSVFCTKWLILEKRRVMLQPGETKEFHLGSHKRQEVDSARFFTDTRVGQVSLRGLTKSYLILMYG